MKRKKQNTKEKQKVKQEGFLKSNYGEAFVFLKKSKAYIITISVIFVAFALLGYFNPSYIPEYMLKIIKELVEKTANMNNLQLFIFIFKNNFTSIFLGMVFGIVLGIYPLIITIFNGYFGGFVAQRAAASSGYPVLLKLLPHGIFELPAIIIAMAVGARFGMFVFAKNKKQEFLHCLENLLRIFLFIILPLLLIAAIIETGMIFFFR
ncbi:stage II sporulation protein M [Candidatus Pacearchaeota archaeon]|nr:stage II sporulation protein M [Candidatus Pacearchaeota archaeon]